MDASQGVEAQTISNLYLAIDAGLEIIPVINKIDLPSAMIDPVKQQIKDLIGCKDEDIILASAKADLGIDEILEAVVKRIPAPQGDPEAPLRALIFDSVFDTYRGSIVYLRVFDGTLREGEKVMFFHNGSSYEAEEVGVLEMKRTRTGSRKSPAAWGTSSPGSRTSMTPRSAIPSPLQPTRPRSPLPGYKEVKPMVFSGMYPTNAEDFEDLRASIEKLQLNDSSLIYEPETSTALGFGFRCGFLGLLHMEIVQERLEREYNQNIINTVPNVEYRVTKTNGDVVLVDNPSFMPPLGSIDKVEEPFIRAQIIVPTEYVGNIMKLCTERRGVYKNTTYLDPTRVDLHYEMPLSEIIFDFYDKLKSTSRGYASFDYEFLDFRESDLVKLDILLNGESVDAFSSIVHEDKAHEWGKKLCVKLRKLIPRQMFEVAIQAAIGSKSRGARDDLRHAEECSGQVLRRRYFAQTQAPRETERGEETYETGGTG